MQFSTILAYTDDRYDTLRRSNGKPYNNNSGSLKRSLVSSLTSNGIFQKISLAGLQTDSAFEYSQADEKVPRDFNKEVWQVNHERASDYFNEMRNKIESQKKKLNER